MRASGAPPWWGALPPWCDAAPPPALHGAPPDEWAAWLVVAVARRAASAAEAAARAAELAAALAKHMPPRKLSKALALRLHSETALPADLDMLAAVLPLYAAWPLLPDTTRGLLPVVERALAHDGAHVAPCLALVRRAAEVS